MIFNNVTGIKGSYIMCDIECGDNGCSIGDAVWFSSDGTEMEIRDDLSDSELLEICDMFDNGEQAYYAMKEWL